MEDGNWSDIIADAMRAEAIIEPLQALWVEVAKFVPNLIGALVILLLGYLIAKVVQKAITGLLRRVRMDNASERVGLAGVLRKAQLRSTASEIMGKILFWVLFLTFLIPATETLGLEKVSETINALIDYLPNVLGAALIVVVGLVVSYFVRNIVWSAAEGVQFQYAEAVGKSTYGVMIVIVAILAVGQLQIETELLNRVIEIVLIAAAAAFGISVGFGGQHIVRNLLAGLFLKDQIAQGEKLRIDGAEGALEGTLEKVGAIKSSIRTDNAMVHVPNGQMLDAVIKITQT